MQGVFLAVGVTLIVPVSALSALALPPAAVKRLAGSVVSVPADIFRGDEAISELEAASEGGPLALRTAYLTSSRVGEALQAAANSDAGEEPTDLLARADAAAAAEDALVSELEAPADPGAAEQPLTGDETGEKPSKGHGQGSGNGNGTGNGQGDGNGNGQGNGNGDGDGGEDDGEPGNGEGNGNGIGDQGQGDGHGNEEGPGQGQGNDNENGQGNGQGQDTPFTAPEPNQDPSDQSGGSENESEPAGNQGGHGQSGGGQNGTGQGKGPKN